MSKHVLLVFTDPCPEREDEYNAWYDKVHVPDVLKVPGFRAAQRFVARTGMRGEVPEHRYLAIYEIEEEDLPAAMAALRQGVEAMELSEAMAPALTTYAFSALSDRVEAEDGRPV